MRLMLLCLGYDYDSKIKSFFFSTFCRAKNLHLLIIPFLPGFSVLIRQALVTSSEHKSAACKHVLSYSFKLTVFIT